ncbi:lysylphosphatidylglycerol synthase transmembrane domain-containing protein [Lacunimicrobium album]
MSKTISLVIGLAVTALFLWLAFRGVDFADLGSQLAKADYRTLPLYLLALATFFVLKAYRWTLLLKTFGKYTIPQVMPALMIGFMGNNILPAHLGEFMRVFVFARDYKKSYTAILSNLILERIFDVVTILAVLIIGLMFVPELFEVTEIRVGAILVCIAAAAILIGTFIFVIWNDQTIHVIKRLLTAMPTFIPHGIAEKIIHLMQEAQLGLKSLHDPWLTIQIAAVSIVHWMVMTAMFFLSLWSFGIEVTIPTALLLMSVTALGVIIPAAPGFFGTIQLAFLLVLTPILHLNEQPALKSAVVGASIYYHLAQYIPVTLIGLYYLHKVGLSLTKVASEIDHVQHETLDNDPDPAVLSN